MQPNYAKASLETNGTSSSILNKKNKSSSMLIITYYAIKLSIFELQQEASHFL